MIGEIQIRQPSGADGSRIWKLVRETGVLDVNSAYCYMMLEKYFSDTCAVAQSGDELIGFVSAFIPPRQPDTLFIWQIAVDARARGEGIGTTLIEHLLERPTSSEVRYLEATISPSNSPSIGLFQRFSRQWKASITTSDGFLEDDFPNGNHEEETLYRIGPFQYQTDRKEILA
ncbi:diaminobutyrate acetyltransferase [Marinicrinis lubricantis]|uniref:L-2,4-diaminobutyric acid acetyltransferase n=1 Tax=Marinicrinis lubricantis TaxID=2086470 RepID=A0ABW1IMR0_9BACL